MTTDTALKPLSDAMLAEIDAANCTPPSYDRSALPTRVLHIGPGAFFRAHQMDYYNRLNANEPKWGVTAVALRSKGTSEKLNAQDGLYTLIKLDRETSCEIIAALKGVKFRDDASAFEPFTSEDLQLVTLTVTEKGYCLNGDGELDEAHADIVHDLKQFDAPVSAIGWLTKGLALRRESGLGKLVVLSCDNLPGNGEKLEAAVLQFANLIDASLSSWIRTNVDFPSSMVDSITPATDDALIQRIQTDCGYSDAWPIQREAFTSWVIENTGASVIKELADAGVLLTRDVSRHEKAKLWLLNGAHSTLAYLGLAYGHQSVAETMENAELRSLVRAMMREEIMPALSPPDGMDLEDYIEDLLERFANPAIVHKLSQIAWDGSQKLPIRLLNTIETNRAAGRSIEKLGFGVAAWMRFIVRMSRAEAHITDPLVDQLLALGKIAKDEREDVDAFLALDEVFNATLSNDDEFVAAVKRAYTDIIKTEQKSLRGGSGI